MPYYQYSATDPTGKTLQGTIQAKNAGEALQMLMGRGLRGPRILAEMAGTAPSPARAPQPQIQQNPIRQQPNIQAPAYRPGAIQISVPTTAPPKTHRTRKSTDKDLFFLFAQIAEQLRAGIGPVQAFSELSHLYKDMKYRDSLSMVAAAASEGRPISDVLVLWPDLYPDHVVGLVRAGEVGGFLPDAALTISEQAEQAHKFKRFHWWIWLLGINALLSVPLVFMFRQSLLTFASRSENGTAPPGLFAVFIVMGEKMIWPWGPILLVLGLATWWLRNLFSSARMKGFRHHLGLKTPYLGGRARNESVTVFSWVLSRLAKGGVPPNRSWELAVKSVPNLAMQERLRTAGVQMNEGSRLSDVVFKSNLFPQEYAPVVATGELTGDVSGALERLSNASRIDYDTSTLRSKIATGSAGCTFFLITFGLVNIVLAWVIYREIYGHYLQEANGDLNPSVSQPSGTNNSNANDQDLFNTP